MLTPTNTELGRSLMTARGTQWLHAHGDDPYAVLLRAEDEDREALAARIAALGTLHRACNGAWVTADVALGAEVLGDPRLVPKTPLGQADLFSAPSAVLTPSASAARRICDERLANLSGELDLATDVVRPVLASLAADLFDVSTRDTFIAWCGSAAIALDAVLCPPRLADARALLDATVGLRELGPGPLLASVVGIEVTANLVTNALRASMDEPHRWQALVSDPAKVHCLIDETLRNDPPVRLDSRVATTDLALAGIQIAEGDEVVVHAEAAGLAGGPHRDQLAPLVRTWASALLQGLVRCLPGLRATGPVVTRLRAPATHAIVRFPATSYGEDLPRCAF